MTWASLSAARIFGEWVVEVEVQILSDHRYVVWSLGLPTLQKRVLDCRLEEGSITLPKRWVLSQLDVDKFRAAAFMATWHLEGPGEWDLSPQEGAKKVVRVMASACDAAMLRSNSRHRRAAYWWTEAIAKLREASVRARRAYARARWRGGDAAREKEGYLQAREALKAAIAEAKKRAWEQLVNSLDDDPGGRGPRQIPVPELEDGDWAEYLEVIPEEFARARKKLGAKGKAPGPNGIPSRAWTLALGEGNLSAAMRELMAFSRRGYSP
ncbi:uncharacterized protein LOC112590179 [Harpegnathos saltator]|uniref:uncharacterized protein LOC112590179 n=1 Tax=Harpegnathos saltator TaxID=610380 RepID=UPI000DBEDB92|nr:uncharacterized protein LOC112590179 [Harpegnathos saltator]